MADRAQRKHWYGVDAAAFAVGWSRRHFTRRATELGIFPIDINGIHVYSRLQVELLVRLLGTPQPGRKRAKS